MLTISQAAKELKVSPKVLRDWDASGKLKATRNSKNHRTYSQQQIELFKNKPTNEKEFAAYVQKTQGVRRIDAFKYAAGLGPKPGTNGLMVPAPQQYSGVFWGGSQFYLNPDQAILNSRINSRNMLRSIDIYEALQTRRLAVALLEGSVVPDDSRDPFQLEVASHCERMMHQMPNFLRLKNALLWAVWHGRYGAQMQYQMVQDEKAGRKLLCPIDFNPVHGDSLEFRFDGEIAISVNNYNSAGVPGLKTLNPAQMSASDKAPAYILSELEREAMIIHKHDVVASDFFEPDSSGSVNGLGLRNWIYWNWCIAREIRGWMTEWLERKGTGITIYYYLRGDQRSYDAAQELAASNSNQAYILAPYDVGETSKVPLVEFIEPDANGLDHMQKVVEYYEDSNRRIILGQDATDRPTKGTGLNSDSASVQERTFLRLIQYDAINLSQTLTDQMLSVIAKYSFPEIDFGLRYVITAERQEPEKFLNCARQIYDMGGELDMTEVYSSAGLTIPYAGDKILKKPDNLPDAKGNQEFIPEKS